VDKVQYGDALVTTAINLYAKCINADDYQEVIDALPFDEDKTAVKEAIGL
jgi:hypothetical protein